MRIRIWKLVTDTKTILFSTQEEAEEEYTHLVNTYLNEPVDNFEAAAEEFNMLTHCIDTIYVEEEELNIPTPNWIPRLVEQAYLEGVWEGPDGVLWDESEAYGKLQARTR